MGELLAQVIPLALGAAISPVLFVLQLSTLTGPRRVARGAAVAAGAAVPLLLMGVAAVVVGGETDAGGNSSLKGLLDIGFGVLLLGLGVRLLRTPPAPPKKKQPSQSLKRSFVYGIAAMGTNITTFALYVPAMKLIAVSGVSVVESVIAAVIVLAITLATVLVPLGLTVLAPGTAERVLSGMGAWMSANQRRNNIVICFAFAALLLAKGIGEL